MRALAGLAVFMTLALVSPARGDAPIGDDEVSLKNGGMLRGTVMSVEPGKSVELLDAAGKSRTIPWAEVDKVSRGKFAAKPAPSRPPAQAAPEEAPGEGPGVVTVHIDSPAPTKLMVITAEAFGQVGGYATHTFMTGSVCDAPCDATVDTHGRTFYVAGDFPASAGFEFGSRQGALALQVVPGSVGKLVGGYVIALLGVTGVLVGLPFALLDLGQASSTWWLVTAAGAVATVGGYYLAVSGVTKVDIEQRAEPPRKSTVAMIALP